MGASPGSCNELGWLDHCSATTDGSQVDVGAGTTTPGGSGSSNGSGGQSGGGTKGGGGSSTAPPAPEEECETSLCRPLYSVVTLPDVTAEDLRSFVPAVPTVTGEPLGLGVVGMPTNLVAAASVQLLSGPLLGYDVTVRFTPTGYRFDHGDGTSRTAATGGATWARLGVPDYTATPTSHVYGAPGSYRAGVRVVYSAAVNFGTGSWRPVTGSVTSATSFYDVRVVEVRTGLVQRTCAEQPSGPGC
ncbi:hypothetical protein [Microbacterium sp. BR1]|uniref:hypothetical protein n=1 Tax=Microbacterium sp. BR1 TaxID=1070896 RepID=UPI0012FDA56A|nr:hypothetical protein [Microbacterium sp. BR1]